MGVPGIDPTIVVGAIAATVGKILIIGGAVLVIPVTILCYMLVRHHMLLGEVVADDGRLDEALADEARAEGDWGPACGFEESVFGDDEREDFFEDLLADEE